jgi:hypothetical protein
MSLPPLLHQTSSSTTILSRLSSVHTKRQLRIAAHTTLARPFPIKFNWKYMKYINVSTWCNQNNNYKTLTKIKKIIDKTYIQNIHMHVINTKLLFSTKQIIYCVYHIELPLLYIGQTVHTAMHRFQQHVNTGRIIRKAIDNNCIHELSENILYPLAVAIARYGYYGFRIVPLQHIPGKFMKINKKQNTFTSFAAPYELAWINRFHSFLPYGLNVIKHNAHRKRRFRLPQNNPILMIYRRQLNSQIINTFPALPPTCSSSISTSTNTTTIVPPIHTRAQINTISTTNTTIVDCIASRTRASSTLNRYTLRNREVRTIISQPNIINKQNNKKLKTNRNILSDLSRSTLSITQVNNNITENINIQDQNNNICQNNYLIESKNNIIDNNTNNTLPFTVNANTIAFLNTIVIPTNIINNTIATSIPIPNNILSDKQIHFPGGRIFAYRNYIRRVAYLVQLIRDEK